MRKMATLTTYFELLVGPDASSNGIPQVFRFEVVNGTDRDVYLSESASGDSFNRTMTVSDQGDTNSGRLTTGIDCAKAELTSKHLVFTTSRKN